MTSSYPILMADDHAMFRKGLKRILAERKDLEVIGEAGDGLELLNLLPKSNSKMIILDISMPRLRGIEAIHEIKTAHPNIKILVLTMHKDPDVLSQAISLGADGYVLKEDAEGELFTAIDAIRRNQVYITPSLLGDLKEDWVRVCRGDRKLPFSQPLTVREKEILKLIAEGKSNREIAEVLFISIYTVQRHRANMMEKLNAKKTADLVRHAMQKGYL